MPHQTQPPVMRGVLDLILTEAVVEKGTYFVANTKGIIYSVMGTENVPIPTCVMGYDSDDEIFELLCRECNTLLYSEAGGQFVQCGNCDTMNAVRPGESIGGQVMIVLCGRCFSRNIAALGTPFLECWLCHMVCRVKYPRRMRRNFENAGNNGSGNNSSNMEPDEGSMACLPFRVRTRGRPQSGGNFPDRRRGGFLSVIDVDTGNGGSEWLNDVGGGRSGGAGAYSNPSRVRNGSNFNFAYVN